MTEQPSPDFTQPPNVSVPRLAGDAETQSTQTGRRFLLWGWMLAAPFIVALLAAATENVPMLASFALFVGAPVILTAVRPIIVPWWALAGCSLAALGLFAAVLGDPLLVPAVFMTLGTALAAIGIITKIAEPKE